LWDGVARLRPHRGDTTAPPVPGVYLITDTLAVRRCVGTADAAL
jgi:hypothetical protein